MTAHTRTATCLLATLLVLATGCTSDGPVNTATTSEPVSTSAAAGSTTLGIDLTATPLPAGYDEVVDACGENTPIDGDIWSGLDAALTDGINPPLRDAMDRMAGSNPTSCRPLEIVEPAINPASVGAKWATSLVHTDPYLRIDVFVYEPGNAGAEQLRRARAALIEALPAASAVEGAFSEDNFAVIYSWLNSEGLEQVPRDTNRVSNFYALRLFE